MALQQTGGVPREAHAGPLEINFAASREWHSLHSVTSFMTAPQNENERDTPFERRFPLPLCEGRGGSKGGSTPLVQLSVSYRLQKSWIKKNKIIMMIKEMDFIFSRAGRVQ